MRGRKPVVEIKYRPTGMTGSDMAYYAGVILGTLHKFGRYGGDEFMAACLPNANNPVNIGDVAFIKLASKYVELRVRA